MTLKKREDNPEFEDLMSRLGSMKVMIARMKQGGSQLSDTDVRIFESTLPNMAADDWSLINTPTTYNEGLKLLESVSNMIKSAKTQYGLDLPTNVQPTQAPLEDPTKKPAQETAPQAGGVGGTPVVPPAAEKPMPGSQLVNGKWVPVPAK